MRSFLITSTAVAAMLFSAVTRAQITSGALSGTVHDANGAAVSNALVTIIFEPTGQRLLIRSHADGRFTAANLRPGSPYSVLVTAIGYKALAVHNLSVTLGLSSTRDYALESTSVQLAVVGVTADRGQVARKTGTSTEVSEHVLQRLPTVSRSLQDMTRLAPEGNGVSFAGSNYRYNNFTIDGASSNDAFGFSQSSGSSTASVPTGTPGGLARTQPISLDAVEQVSVSLSPFDVKIGSFTGASVNAVTRAGTNSTMGSMYSFAQAPSFIGRGLSGTLPTGFKNYSMGARLGGPLLTNRVFYFLNAEVSRHTDPVLFAPGSTGALLTGNVAALVRDSLKSYAARAGFTGFDPGSIGNYTINANSQKFLARIDANFGSSVLTVRDNFVSAEAGNLERGQSLNKLASQDFVHHSTTNGLVAELKSQIGNSLSNSLIGGFSVVSDKRTPYGAQISPQIEIADLGYGQINAGSDRESAVYRQHTSTLEFTDNLTWNGGRHTVTIGSHNEMYKVQYTFLNSYNGRWQYPNLAAFLAGQPNRIRATYSVNNNTLSAVSGTPGADFTVFTPSAYVQDEIALASNLRLSLGVRIEATSTDKASQASTFANFTSADGAQPFAKYANDYGRSITVAPRIGFTWDIEPQSALVVRGGVGVFQGRMPFAWFAYPFLNNGIQFANVDYRPAYNTTLTSVPLIIDPNQQSTINSLYKQGNVYEINLIDNKYVQPQMARGNLAVDLKLPARTRLTLEGSYTKVLKDILYTNQDIPTSSGKLGGADPRPIYPASRLIAPIGVANPYSAVYVLGNTNQGFRYNLTASLRKTFGDGFDLTSAYTFGRSKDIANGQRNSPQSNVEYNQLYEANKYPLVYSNFDIRHRVVATASWNHAWSTRTATSASVVYTGQSGSPFSYVYTGDVNNDGSANNDLIYIPRNQSEINLVPSSRPAGLVDLRAPAQIWTDLDRFISSDSYLNSHRGQVAERNGARTPWNHRADLRLSQDIRVDQKATPHNLQLTIDILNVSNLLNRSWGKFYFVPNLNNQNVYPLAYRSGRGIGSTPNFSFDPSAGTPYQVDDLQSRWQLQAGLRYTF